MFSMKNKQTELFQRLPQKRQNEDKALSPHVGLFERVCVCVCVCGCGCAKLVRQQCFYSVIHPVSTQVQRHFKLVVSL